MSLPGDVLSMILTFVEPQDLSDSDGREQFEEFTMVLLGSKHRYHASRLRQDFWTKCGIQDRSDSLTTVRTKRVMVNAVQYIQGIYNLFYQMIPVMVRDTDTYDSLINRAFLYLSVSQSVIVMYSGGCKKARELWKGVDESIHCGYNGNSIVACYRPPADMKFPWDRFNNEKSIRVEFYLFHERSFDPNRLRLYV